MSKTTSNDPAAADAARNAAAESIVAKLQPRPEHRDAFLQHVRDRIRIDEGANGPEVAFTDKPGGLRIPSALPGASWVGIDEYSSSEYVRQDAPAEWFVSAPAAPQEAPVEAFVPPPRDVSITAAQARDFKTYEAARSEATKRGGQLHIVADAAAPPPPPSPTPNGRDVLLTAEESRNFQRYEAAKRLAVSRGGEVVIVGGQPIDPNFGNVF